MPVINQTRILLLLSVVLNLLVSQDSRAADMPALHFRCGSVDETRDRRVRLAGVNSSKLSAGALVSPAALPNIGSWQFDGREAIAYAVPSNSNGFSENFTWEGFFLAPSSNTYLAETGIADRLVTQFAFDKGNWTRLAIGLVSDGQVSPRLSVELEGFDGRSFGQGDRIAEADRWHHFALVHEGTASAARIRWYLDYELTGELLLGGQSNQNTLRPPGAAPLTIGARLRTGQQVNRGFEGWIDEVRLTPQALKVDAFLRCDGASRKPVVTTHQLHERPDDKFWTERHQWAIEQSAAWRHERVGPSSIDAHFEGPVARIDDAAFIRRLSLTVLGRIPMLADVERFLKDDRRDKRASHRSTACFTRVGRWVGRILAGRAGGESVGGVSHVE